jgi:hypothetical protein
VAEIIQFPDRGGTRTVHFNELHPFGEVGGLRLSLVQEKDKADEPFALVLLGGTEGFRLLGTFEPKPEGMDSIILLGEMTMKALVAAHATWTD